MTAGIIVDSLDWISMPAQNGWGEAHHGCVASASRVGIASRRLAGFKDRAKGRSFDQELFVWLPFLGT